MTAGLPTLAIVYSFAVEDELLPVVGAAPFGVLARQIPRLLVNSLNGAADAGIRFFPLLGKVAGERQFFVIPELLALEKLRTLHGLGESVPFVVDGRLSQGSIDFRVHDANQVEVLRQTVDFDPLDPLPAARRMLFELGGAFAFRGAPPELPDISQPALSFYLVARDDLLGLEAGFCRNGDDPWLKAAAEAIGYLPESVDVQSVVLDICRHIARRNLPGRGARDLLLDVIAADPGTQFVAESAAVLDDLGYREDADALFERVAGFSGVSAAVAVRLAGYLFRQARYAEGRDHLEAVRGRGRGGVRLLAQLAVLYERLGQIQERRVIIDELSGSPRLSPTIARMVCCDLVDQVRLDAALRVVEDCLRRFPEDASLWLEKGRVLLHGENPRLAEPALDAALALQPSAVLKEEVARLKRFVDLPDVLPALRAVDASLAGGHVKRALGQARQLVLHHPHVAESWLFLGVVHQRMEQDAAAIGALERAVELDAELGEAQNRLGILLVCGGRVAEGRTRLECAAKCLPGDPGPSIHLAQACFLLGDPHAAEAALVRARSLGADEETVQAVYQVFRDHG